MVELGYALTGVEDPGEGALDWVQQAWDTSSWRGELTGAGGDHREDDGTSDGEHAGELHDDGCF